MALAMEEGSDNELDKPKIYKYEQLLTLNEMALKQ